MFQSTWKANAATAGLRCTCLRCNRDGYEKSPHPDPTRTNADFKRRYTEAKMFTDVFSMKMDFHYYEYLQLAEACAQTFAVNEKHNPARTKRLYEARDMWRMLKRNQRSKSSVSLFTLKAAMFIFDDFFFHGSLQAVPLIIKTHIYEGKRRLFGTTSYSSDLLHAQIIIDPPYCWQSKNTKHRLENIFLSACGCLLHEMCHVFLGLYGCDANMQTAPQETCNRGDDTSCAQHNNDNVGAHHHGRAWHVLVKAIQDRSPDMLGTPMKLFDSSEALVELTKELHETDTEADRWLPSECDLERFFSEADAIKLREAIAEKRNTMYVYE